MGINQLFIIGGRPIQFGGLLRSYAEKPEGAADWGFQLRVTFILPRQNDNGHVPVREHCAT
jgi:hypothetical protein